MTRTVVNIFGKEYHIEDLYKIVHEESDGILEFSHQFTDYICDNSEVRHFTVYGWVFTKKQPLAGDAKVTVYVRYYSDTDTLGLYYCDDPQESVHYHKKKKKQFRRKDYDFRHDLGGICVGYNMDWFSKSDGSMPSEWEERMIAYDIFNGRKERLNVGEYFTMEIFGNKLIAYRNEEGTFTL